MCEIKKNFSSYHGKDSYAEQELERCQKEVHLKGLKLHFSKSRVELRNPDHIKKMRRILYVAAAPSGTNSLG
jgi:predicted TIM-barrel fold metal-dependent hydrolase